LKRVAYAVRAGCPDDYAMAEDFMKTLKQEAGF
jgi:hypothetical protein